MKVAQLYPTLCDRMDYTVHGILQARILVWVAFPFSRGSWIKPRSPTVRMDSLPAEPQGKPKNTGVGGLSLFQRIFLTEDLNRGLLLCRRLLFQLSYQGNPKIEEHHKNLWHTAEAILRVRCIVIQAYLRRQEQPE